MRRFWLFWKRGSKHLTSYGALLLTTVTIYTYPLVDLNLHDLKGNPHTIYVIYFPLFTYLFVIFLSFLIWFFATNTFLLLQPTCTESYIKLQFVPLFFKKFFLSHLSYTIYSPLQIVLLFIYHIITLLSYINNQNMVKYKSISRGKDCNHLLHHFWTSAFLDGSGHK